MSGDSEQDGNAGRKAVTVRHKIGGTRTTRTAVLVCEYLRDKCAQPHSEVHPDSIRYHFIDPTPQNGFWSADIIIEHHALTEKTSHEFVTVCRAFVAGAGEIW